MSAVKRSAQAEIPLGNREVNCTKPINDTDFDAVKNKFTFRALQLAIFTVEHWPDRCKVELDNRQEHKNRKHEKTRKVT